MMEFPKKASIDGKMMDIVSHETYGKHKELYANQTTAVECEIDGEMYALPYRKPLSTAPGIYDAGAVYFIKEPKDSEKEMYSMDHLQIIDYNDTEQISDFLNKQDQLRNIEEECLTDIDDVFTPPIGVDDTGLMRAMKQALSLKQCDINKYADRFGSNFLNNKRILKGNSISIGKAELISKCLDIEMEVVLRDNRPDVPNPMGKEVHVVLTRGGGEQDDE